MHKLTHKKVNEMDTMSLRGAALYYYRNWRRQFFLGTAVSVCLTVLIFPALLSITHPLVALVGTIVGVGFTRYVVASTAEQLEFWSLRKMGDKLFGKKDKNDVDKI